MEYTTSQINAGQASLHVRWLGAGPILVLLPGLGRPAADLDPLAALLARAGYLVVQPDPRGSGGSIGPMDGLTLHDLAADVAGVINSLWGRNVVVIGQGFGNRIARMAAADWPDLVRSVVLLGCSGLVQPSAAIAEAIRLAQAVDTPPNIRAKAAQSAWFPPGHDAAVWVDGWSQPVMNAYLAAAAATDTASWWTAGSARVLIVQGAEDAAAPPANGHLLRAEIGDRAALVELPDIGHAIGVEGHDLVASVILRYLTGELPSVHARPAGREATVE